MFGFLAVGFVVWVFLMTWALCKAASDEDDQIERMMENDGESETIEQ